MSVRNKNWWNWMPALALCCYIGLCLFLFVLEINIIESKKTFTSVGYMMLFDLSTCVTEISSFLPSVLQLLSTTFLWIIIIMNIIFSHLMHSRFFCPECVYMAFDGHLHDVRFQTNTFDRMFNISISFLYFNFGVGDYAFASETFLFGPFDAIRYENEFCSHSEN